jgi:hypothetical protein
MWQGKLSGFGHFEGLFGRDAAGFAVTVYNNILAKQCLLLQFFLYGVL